jgi:hypothetical protein
MKRITPPLKLTDQSPEITNLHEGLKLLDIVIIPAEVSRSLFGKRTDFAIRKFQEANRLVVTGIVDETTAKMLNELLEAKGAFKTPTIRLNRHKGSILKGNLPRLRPGNIDSSDRETKELVEERLTDFFTEILSAELGNLSPALEEALTEMKIDFASVKDQSFKVFFRDTVLPELKEQEHLRREVSLLERKSRTLPTETIGALLYLDRPLQLHPAFSRQIRNTRNTAIAKMINLKEDALTKLLDLDIDLDVADGETFDRLVKDMVIGEKEVEELKFINETGRLTGDHLPMMASLRTRKLQTADDLIALEKNDWLKLVEEEKIEPPEGETKDSYADAVLFNLDQTFPSRFLLQRVVRSDKKARLDRLDDVNALLQTNERLVDQGGAFAIDWKGVDAESRNKMENALSELVETANTFRHLGVADIINDKTRTVTEKKTAITGRLGALDTFYVNNAALDLQFADFFRDSADEDGATPLNWEGISGGDRPLVRKQLMAYQRVLELGDDAESRQQLLQKGFDSSFHILNHDEAGFVKKSGIDKAKAEAIYARAGKSAMTASHHFAALRDVVKGGFQRLAVSNLRPSDLVNDLKDIDGFEQLFGNQDFCDCAECRSIFSPAAYFVDLMWFIETNISNKVFAGLPADHPIHLRTRRPDLWTLELSCDHTHGLIPYLDIVNEVLEAYLKKVFNTGDLFQKLMQPSEKISFATPFNLPLEETRNYLRHFDIPLQNILEVLNRPATEVLRERLQLSEEVFTVLTVPDQSASVLLRYGNRELADIRIEDVLRYAVITRKDLDDLLGLTFTHALKNLFIEQVRKSGEVQNSGERFKGLSLFHLDFIHRFVRLWKKLPWAIRELDLVIGSVQSLNGIFESHKVKILEDDIITGKPRFEASENALDAKTVEGLAQALSLSEGLKLTAEELCGVISVLPDSPAKAGEPGLFNRLFNPEHFFDDQQKIRTYHHYSLNKKEPTDKATDPFTPVLLGGLGVTETELLLLFDLLQQEMPFDVSGDCKLGPYKISLLYRHARIAKALKLSVEELIKVLQLVTPALHLLSSVEQIEEIIRFRRWLKKSPFSVHELWLLLKGQESGTTKFKSSIEGSAGWITGMQAERLFSFSKDVLSQVAGLKSDASMIVHAMEKGKLLERDEKQSCHLTAAYSLSQDFSGIFTDLLATNERKLGAPDLKQLAEDLQFHEGEIRSTFNAFHPKNIVFDFLAKMLNIGRDYFDLLNTLITPVFSEGEYFGLLHGSNGQPLHTDTIAKLVGYTRQIEGYISLFENLKLKPASIAFVLADPRFFKIKEGGKLTLDTVVLLTFYRSQIRLKDDAEPLIQQSLVAYAMEQTFTASSAAFLSAAWQKEISLILSLVQSISLPPSPLEALRKLEEAVRLCDGLGINGYTLLKFSADGEGFGPARNAVIGAFRSKYAEDKIQNEKMEPYQDKINVLKRNVLCTYILALERRLNFSDTAELYSYFLLDVEMSGDFRTSRVVAGLSSLQLYVHRCLLNLEQSGGEQKAFKDVDVMGTIKGRDWDQIVAEWSWRKNYRVWEANRKVFLYPENYIEPDLRDNKSPIFKELEEELLQQKITKESAEAAYKNYLSQFVELAKLKIAGCYYDGPVNPLDFSGRDKTYYFFGCTPTDPPQYYYRKWVDCKEWKPWEKIELSISARNLSAAVHRGKLYIFWIEVSILEKNKVVGGKSDFYKYEYTLTLNYSFLNENNKWAPAQKLQGVFEVQGANQDTGLKNEELINEKENAIENISKQIEALEEQKKADKNAVAAKTSDQAVRDLMNKIIDSYYSIPIADLQRSQDQLKNEIELLKQQDVDNSAMNALRTEGQENQLKESFLTGKGYRKAYPFIQASALKIEYAWIRPDVDAYLEKGAVISQNLKTRISEVDLFHNLLLPTFSDKENRSRTEVRLFTSGPRSSLFLETGFSNKHEGGRDVTLEVTKVPAEEQKITADFLHGSHRPVLSTVNRSIGDYIFECKGQTFLITSHADPIFNRVMVRLGTAKTDELGTILFEKGIDEFLSIRTQALKEPHLDFTIKKLVQLWPSAVATSQPFKEYYRELFFHIPFLIANHLNANQKFKEAKYWYEKIFNPMANEEGNEQNIAERNWRYAEFRNLKFETLKELLTNEEAIKKYEDDPFNPHAIARLRLNAYQKSVVMKYIDNLLDWGDQLFTQDSTESINEATMLYVLAGDILGDRPMKSGKCETLPESALTYATLRTGMEEGSPFLVELENWKSSVSKERLAKAAEAGLKLNRLAGKNAILGPGLTPAAKANGAERISDHRRLSKKIYPFDVAARIQKGLVGSQPVHKQAKFKRFPSLSVVQQSGLAFCIPPNADLAAYWDRVEDRLFKIRNCMNISGVRRSLALFQPPIDPMMLVRAKAAGLSMEDIQGMLAAQLPPYRFGFLLEKARQFASTVQSFGSALLIALEKKDVEELTLLRSTHEQNILTLAKDIKLKNVDEAIAQREVTVASRVNAETRFQYYSSLLDSGLTSWEVTQQVAKHTSTQFKAFEAEYNIISAVTYLIPQAGSPFSMKYGGKEIADSAGAWAGFFGSLASFAEAISSSAGLEATFQRREEEWSHQKAVAFQEMAVFDKQLIAADIKVALAGKDLDIHNKQMEQAGELHEAYKDKFSNLGLYTYLSTQLNRLYRQAYNMALDIAKKAEQTYQFERDDNSFFIANDNWQPDRAGLLGGEKLLLQLQQMERTYLEKNVREQEITQTLSVMQLNPRAILDLRETGRCQINLPEFIYDLLYPGQYRRLIRSVRLTIPCITGPFTNISAKLTLLNSRVRKGDQLNPEESMTDIGIAKNTSITTSSANGDGGMFELNFRDERYLPFEGAGAVSDWRLELPARMRSFNYDSISDVIFHISYTAKDDGVYREKVETQMAESLMEAAQESGLSRLFSLRYEFPDAFHRLLHSQGEGQLSSFTLEQLHFPYFLLSASLNIEEVKIYLKPKKWVELSIDGVGFKINTNEIPIENVSWEIFSENMWEGKAKINGSPVGNWLIDAKGLDKELLDDILLFVKYTASIS